MKAYKVDSISKTWQILHGSWEGKICYKIYLGLTSLDSLIIRASMRRYLLELIVDTRSPPVIAFKA